MEREKQITQEKGMDKVEEFLRAKTALNDFKIEAAMAEQQAPFQSILKIDVGDARQETHVVFTMKIPRYFHGTFLNYPPALTNAIRYGIEKNILYIQKHFIEGLEIELLAVREQIYGQAREVIEKIERRII